MIYRQRNKKKNKGWLVCLVLLALFIVLRFFNIDVTGGLFSKGVHMIQESKFAAFGPIQNVRTYFSDKDTLAEENARLKTENMDLKIEVLTSGIISEEFDRFNRSFGVYATNTPALKVIGRPPFVPFDFIHVVGSDVSHNLDDLVFYQQVVIGKIVDKDGRYATVQLFSNHQTVVPGVINNTQFEVQGLGGGRYVVEVPKDFEVAEGDAVLYPHEKVLVLGLVSSVESTSEDLFKNIYFNIPVTLSEIDYVTVAQPETSILEDMSSDQPQPPQQEQSNEQIEISD